MHASARVCVGARVRGGGRHEIVSVRVTAKLRSFASFYIQKKSTSGSGRYSVGHRKTLIFMVFTQTDELCIFPVVILLVFNMMAKPLSTKHFANQFVSIVSPSLRPASSTGILTLRASS
eukprot:GEMP01096654.1.p1 GENE.GEMP01096654.1~~GEMP01096654.1.p1  ORF type:complete len:119 (-),score=11.92 GEMP01096654.1:125-481(-)